MNFLYMVSVGFALFAMLFGSGNAILPLILGRDVGDSLFVGALGFFITAVIFPVIGLLAAMLCDGQYGKLLGKMGKIPGALVLLVCMLAFGPLGIAPRCIAVSYGSLKPYTSLSLLVFSIIAAGLILLCTIKKSKVMDLLGMVLGPIKLFMLLVFVVLGLFSTGTLQQSSFTSASSFFYGLHQGYGTGDLISSILFSGLILSSLVRYAKRDNELLDYKKLASMGFQVGAVAAVMLGLVYAGFCLVDAMHSDLIVGVADGDIFGRLSIGILGRAGGLFANSAVAISCLATAIGLVTVFATYFQQELLAGAISYEVSVIGTVIVTALMTNLGFSGIMKVLMPLISAVYPALIVLALTSSAEVLFGFRWIKIPVFITLFATLLIQYGHHIGVLSVIGLA